MRSISLHETSLHLRQGWRARPVLSRAKLSRGLHRCRRSPFPKSRRALSYDAGSIWLCERRQIVRTTRDVTDRQLRRARLLAARTRDYGSLTRRRVLAGDWDRGVVVRATMDTGRHDTPTQVNDDERI